MDEDGPRPADGATPSMPPPPPAQPDEPRGLSARPVTPAPRPVAPVGSLVRLGGWMMMVGGAIALASAFLPRITASGVEISSGGVLGSGIGMLLLAGFAIAKGFQVVRPDVMKARLSSPLLTGALLLVLAGIRYTSLRSDVESLQAIPGVTASIGSGFWIGVIGAAIVALGGALIHLGDRAR
jgi:hypothetical protein